MNEDAITRGPEETAALAGRVAGRLAPGAVLALHGELGSGKTCFVQGLARALGVVRPVTSPTFTLVQEYRTEGNRRLIHADLYRLQLPADVLMLGLDEYWEAKDGFVVVEWADRAEGLFPPSAVSLFFEVGAGPQERRIRARHSLAAPLFAAAYPGQSG